MKTSKSISKTGKPSGSKKQVKLREVNVIKSRPTEEEIREKAKEIYHQRLERGEHGTAVDDWLEAEECLRDSGD